MSVSENGIQSAMQRLTAAQAEIARLTEALEAERAGADALVVCLRDAMSPNYEWKPALHALEEHAARRSSEGTR